MTTEQVKKNRIMLGWAYLALIPYSAGTFLFAHFAKPTFLKGMHLLPIFIISEVIQITLLIFLVIRVVALAGSLNRSKIWWAISCLLGFLCFSYCSFFSKKPIIRLNSLLQAEVHSP